MSLAEKIKQAKERLSMWQGDAVYVGHSGGKDSVVVHHLAQEVFGKFVPVIHTPKTTGFNAVHPDTIDFLYQLSAETGLLMVPFDKMRDTLESRNLSIQVDGTRADEHDRVDRSANVVIDGKDISRKGMSWKTCDGLFGQTSVFPIFDWSDDDVWTYISENSLAVSKEYNLSAAR